MPERKEARSRLKLSLPTILDGALRLVERDGPRGLTMRQLGRELGVEAMSLYRYVASLEVLVDALVDRVVEDMLNRPEMQPLPDEDWRAFLTRQARGVRSIATDQPAVFPLIATHPPVAPWIRPPLRSLRWVEDFLSGLLARGFGDEGAAAAYRTFTSFLLGTLLLEVSAHGVATGPLEQDPPQDVTPADSRGELERFPAVARLADQLATDDPDAEFQAALTGLLDRIERLNGLPSPSGAR